ncbi:MAG TPA: DUF2852 domain-containing protein [Albidovulum sp.]|uniref:DUF2852 domain-containing protein n=1 Tax=Albidovulum sp. TaxID=1872424 RepID=UPI002C295B6D|nr:DUF2852 domain-containing protein [Albidovulum sp.]
MSTIAAWPSRAELWLDQRGKGAWIAAMVLGFIAFWPIGLALLAYMIWSKRMFSKCQGRLARHDHHAHMNDMRMRRYGFRPSGNSAFDAYKADTIDRLEHEQDEFEAFLKRLRESKDKAEFDEYLNDRARAAKEAPGEGPEGEGSGKY